MADILLSIGLVTYNRLSLTMRCLNSLFEKIKTPYELLVADNASQDGTQDYLRSLYQKGLIQRLILFNKNVGVAPASNSLWDLSQSSVFLKLDNDIEIYDPLCFNKMLEIHDQNNEKMILAYSFLKQLYNIQYPLKTLNSGHEVQIPEANLGGACIMIPQSVKETLGYWCEDYAPYGEEDTDYSLRARLANIDIYYMKETESLKHLYCPSNEQFDAQAYRDFKNKNRSNHLDQQGIFNKNLAMYQYQIRSLYMPRKFKTQISGINADLTLDKNYSMNLSQALKKLSILESRQI